MTQQLPPLCVELPYPADSARYFSRLRSLRWPVFLDSAGTGMPDGRYDIMAAEPFLTLETRGQTSTLTEPDGQVQHFNDDPFSLLHTLLSRYRQPAVELP